MYIAAVWCSDCDIDISHTAVYYQNIGNLQAIVFALIFNLCMFSEKK